MDLISFFVDVIHKQFGELKCSTLHKIDNEKKAKSVLKRLR